MQKYVESPLSVSVLSGQFTRGDTVVVDIDEAENRLVFSKQESELSHQLETQSV